MYEYLRSLLVAKAEAADHVIVILDAFENFVRENSNAKQLLLYSLLNWLQVQFVACFYKFSLVRFLTLHAVMLSFVGRRHQDGRARYHRQLQCCG